MKRKTLLFVSAIAAASIFTAGTAMAKEYVSADGNISVELPGDEWNEMHEPEAEFVLTNGSDVIRADKYEADEKVELARNEEDYDAVLQLSYAYEDQLIVLTAQVAEADHLPEIYEAITSVRFSNISADDDAVSDADDSVSDADAYMYVNAGEGLNLRDDHSLDSNVLTTIPYEARVHVIGTVESDDDIHWVRVEYNGQTGYAASSLLVEKIAESSATPDSTSVKEDPVSTPEKEVPDTRTETMYRGDGTQVTITVLNDGTRLDANGNKIVGIADGACQMVDGTVLYAFDPTKMSADEWLNGDMEEEKPVTDTPEEEVSGAQNAENRNNITSSTYLYYENGTPLLVGVLNDGYSLVDYDGFRIEGIAENAYLLPDGNIVYSYNPATTNPEQGE